MPQVVRAHGEISEAVAAGLSDSVNDNGRKNYFFNRLWVGTAGNVVIVLEDDTTLTLHSVIAGRWHIMPPFKRVNGTNTTAVNVRCAVTF